MIGTTKVRGYLEQNAVGSTMKNLNLKILAETPIVYPDLAIQAKVAKSMAVIDAYRDAINKELQARRKQFEHYRDKLLDFPEKVA